MCSHIHFELKFYRGGLLDTSLYHSIETEHTVNIHFKNTFFAHNISGIRCCVNQALGDVQNIWRKETGKYAVFKSY